MREVRVLGRTMEAALVGWVLRQHPTVRVESAPGSCQGDSAFIRLERAASGVAASSSLEAVLGRLEVPYSVFKPEVGVLRGGQVLRAGGRQAHRIRLDQEELYLRLGQADSRRRSAAPGTIIWATKRPGTHGEPTKRCAFTFVQATHSRLLRYDQVRTPFTPELSVSALLMRGPGWLAVHDGDEARLLGDLCFIFPEGFRVGATVCGDTYVESGSWDSEVEPNGSKRTVLAIGRDAQRAEVGLGAVVDQAYELLRRLTRRRVDADG